MNAPNTSESTALAAAAPQFNLAHVDAASLMLGPMWDRIQAVGKMMARGAVTIPKHLQGNEADCCAVALQAFGWGMNPFAVAQKTHITKGGALGYEAQLVNAVIQASGALDGDPDYEYLGDWSKVLGKVKEMKSDNGGKYYVATYTAADEEGLGITVKARLRGETKVRELTVMMSQAWPRFSTQWATDPKQQIAYLTLRKFVRLHKPGVLLGVYSNDELEPVAGAEKFMGPADVVPRTDAPTAGPAAAPPPAGAGLPTMTEEDLAKRTAKVQEFYTKGKKADDIIAFYGQKFTVPEPIQKRIREMAQQPAADKQVTDVQPKGDDAPKVAYPEVAAKIERATTTEQIDEAETLIPAIQNEEHRKELTAKAEARRAELAGD